MGVRLLFVLGIAAAFLFLTPASASAHCHKPTAYHTEHAAAETPAGGSSGDCGEAGEDSRKAETIVVVVSGASVIVYTSRAILASGPSRRFSNLDPPTYEQTEVRPWSRERWTRDNAGTAAKAFDGMAKSAVAVVRNPAPPEYGVKSPAAGSPDPALGGLIALAVVVARILGNR